MPEVSASPIGRLVAARSLNTFGRAIISATVLWELYARYRTARKSFANDTSECGTIVPVTITG